jgi:hypothetical protein
MPYRMVLNSLSYLSMRRLPKQNIEIDPIAHRIFEEVVCSMEQYTHDSTLSKFYLPEYFLKHCRDVSSIFAQIHYAPLLEPKKAVKSRIFGLFFLSINCGAQIFLKERSIFTNFAPYSLYTDEKIVKDIKQRVTKMLFDGATILETTDQAMKIFLEQLVTPKQVRRLMIYDHDFDVEKFDRFMPASILWGYLFAKEMVIE